MLATVHLCTLLAHAVQNNVSDFSVIPQTLLVLTGPVLMPNVSYPVVLLSDECVRRSDHLACPNQAHTHVYRGAKPYFL